MPTTRAARRAAAARLLLELPADVLGLVLYQLTLAHDIAAVAPTCHQLCDAAKLARKLRPFSGEVVTLAGHADSVHAVSAAPDGRIFTGSNDNTVKVWRDGVCVRTIKAHSYFSTPSRCCRAERASSAVRTTRPRRCGRSTACSSAPSRMTATCVPSRRCPTACTSWWPFDDGEVRLYHVDGTLVHTFEGHGEVFAVASTRDGQHIISGSDDHLVKVWSVASKSLVSTCAGHDGWILAVAAMPDGQRILSSSLDDTVRVWLLDGTLKNTFSELHTSPVEALVALPDNQHALSASVDRTVKLFNVNDGAVLRTFRHHTSGGVLPGAAARRPPLRQRLERQHRPHRRARPRALRLS